MSTCCPPLPRRKSLLNSISTGGGAASSAWAAGRASSRAVASGASGGQDLSRRIAMAWVGGSVRRGRRHRRASGGATLVVDEAVFQWQAGGRHLQAVRQVEPVAGQGRQHAGVDR